MRITAFDRQTGQTVVLQPQDVPTPDVPLDERRYVDVRIEQSGSFVATHGSFEASVPEFVPVPDAPQG